ncbi:MAG: glycosyltransferase [Promethearchaeota archaeon]
MKDLLMIAYYYPPLGGVGVLRPLGFSKYLPEFGWNTTVLSVGNDYSYTRDESLIQSIPKQQKIARPYRIPLYQAIRRFARGPLRKYPLAYTFMDPQFDWVNSAIKIGTKLSKKCRIDAIFATAPPYSSIRVATTLKKKLGLPTIADFRDPFTTNFTINWPSKLHKKFYQLYERRLLTSVDHLIAVNNIIRAEWLNSIGKPLPPVDVITNGYDPAYFDKPAQQPSPDRFLMSYVGSIYGDLTALPFFKSLSLAIKQRPEMKDNLEVCFMGHMNQVSLLHDSKRYHVDQIVKFLGHRQHQEAISLMQRSHLLLDFRSIIAPAAIPSKIFEYGASNRPVLSFSRPGILADFINQNGYGYTVDWSQPKEGCKKIIELYDMWSNNEPIPGPPKSIVEKYSRRNLAKRLASILSDYV